MAFCRGREAEFRERKAMAMERGSFALWLRRTEAKWREW
jgi:hypothetical protein